MRVKTDMRTVFEISREIFRGNFQAIQKKYGEAAVSAELLAVIGSITDSEELVSQAQEGEVQNMCTALENLKKEGVREGIQQGLRQRTQEIVYTLLGKGYTESEVAALLEMSEEMVEELKKESKS